MARLQRTIDSHEEFAAENIKVSRSLQTCQEDLHKNAQLQHGIERDLMGLKQKLSSFQSRDEACWQSLKRSQVCSFLRLDGPESRRLLTSVADKSPPCTDLEVKVLSVGLKTFIIHY